MCVIAYVKVRYLFLIFVYVLQVIEPKLGDGGEVIAIVAINVSVISVFSRLVVHS